MKDVALLPQTPHVRHLGQGPRRVLALHCTIAHSGAWKGLAGELGQEATFVAPDMLSHGRSRDWDRQGDFQDRITDIAETQLSGPMDVIGHSFGATVALRLAVQHPDLVRSVVLIEPVFFAVAKRDAPDLIDLHHRDAEPYLDAMAEGDEALAARLFNRMWSTEDSPRWPQLPESTRAAMIRGIHVVPFVDPALFDDRAGLLQPGVLDRAAMPVLLLRGSLTHPVMTAINEGLARRLPDAESLVIDGAGHMLPISHPAETAGKIRALWARV
ncbi:alpha/beta hydrolase [Ruegeria sediminis]|uniref:Alpha/beta hydrolase n=1 Tax=Ruegeria sediminis TaxID=2583820 RepID=A0ABY2X513_9RHOB|nr:alpha/beta hydrolase [Ruegeria sediminis]TMV09897.1 alpha/beta hydrolase [Ruegeria sediminis]